MMWTKAIIIICLIYFAWSMDDNEDTEVEFSSPENSKPVENAKNATILITQEIETHVPHQSDQLLKSADVKADNTSTNASDTKNKIKVECAQRIIPENEVPKVLVTNSSMLLKYLTPPAASNVSTNECVVVLFYSPQCVFSARMAPHYNALARVYPDIAFYAVDAMDYGNLHVRYGLVYVPNVMLFHNAKPIARFNETVMTLDTFVKFINKFTGLEHNETSLNVTSADMNGPVPSTLTKKVDYVLILAWVFTIACMCFGFVKSSFCRRFVDLIKNTWQEAAAAQHEHED